MSKEKRTIVIPSQLLGDIKKNKAGSGTFIENGKIYSEILGVLNKNKDFINVTAIKGRYNPRKNDSIIGIIEEAKSSIWVVDINAASPLILHINEVPWKVEFGETEKYLNYGDTIKAKIIEIDQKLQVTLKDRDLYKIKNGHLINFEPSKFKRIIGRSHSMESLLKKYSKCQIHICKNGRIWINGSEDGIKMVRKSIRLIEKESLSYGLTDKVEKLLKKDAKDVQ